MPRQNATHQDGPGHVIHASDVNDPDLYLANLSRGVYTAAEYGAVGDGTTDDSAKLAATDAAAGTGGAAALAPTANGHRVAANTTLAAGWHIPPGAKFSIDAGVTLTVNGQPHAGPYRIFTGSGAVRYGPMVVAPPEWKAGAGASRALSLPHGWDDCWRSAKANAGATPAVLLAIGDSITQGYSTSDMMSASWYELVRAGLIAQFGWAGDYYPVTHSSDWTAGQFTGVPPWTLTTTNRAWAAWGLGQMAYYTAAAATPNLLTFHYNGASGPNRTFTAFQLVYFDWTAGGSWQYATDGGAAQIVPTAGGNVLKKTVVVAGSSSGLANTDHSIAVGVPSAGSMLGLCGINVFPSLTPTGVFCGQMGIATATMQSNWGDSGSQPLDKIAQLQGKTTGATGFGLPTQPHLAIITLGINDMQQALAGGPSGFQGDLVRQIAAFRRGQPYGTVLVVAAYASDPASGDMTSGQFGNSSIWWQYLDAMQRTAAAYGCGFFSLPAKWGQLAATNGMIGSTNNHPTPAGHQDIATTLLAIL